MEAANKSDLFTDCPQRDAGIWKQQKLFEKWDSICSLAEQFLLFQAILQASQ